MTNRLQLAILIGLALLLNLKTLFNDYSLDDIVVLVEHKYVQKGIAGIPEILTTDLMQGYSSVENLLEQKRYRPFSLVVNAVEYQFFGANPFVSHLVNLILFAILIFLLFKLLRDDLFKSGHPLLAFLACLFFVVHPIHTEVIASVKSRDELITFLFLILTLINLLHWDEYGRSKNLIVGCVAFFLSLLTRESAVTFVAVLPAVLIYFRGQKTGTALKKSIPLLIVFVLYMVVRYSVIGLSKPVVTDVLNAPYLLASAEQAFATKVFVLLKYIWLLVFPYPLSSDYSYNQIPYIGIASFKFVLASVVLIALAIIGVRGYQKKSVLSFSILYFFVTISLIANFIVDIGTPLSERLLFQASLAYCIILANLFLQLSESARKWMIYPLLVVIVLYSTQTILRNADWKNNETLFFADVKSAPNSARTTLYALELYRAKAQAEQDPALRKKYFSQAIEYGKHSLEIYPDFSITMLNLGFAYFYQGELDSTAYYWKRGYELNKSDTEAVKCIQVVSDIYYKKGNGASDHGDIRSAIDLYKKSVDVFPEAVEAWYNLGGCYYYIGDTIAGNAAWSRVKALDPSHEFSKKDFFLQ